jgi:hypothetical protein
MLRFCWKLESVMGPSTPRSKAISALVFQACTSKPSCKLERMCHSGQIVLSPYSVPHESCRIPHEFLSFCIELYKQHKRFRKLNEKKIRMEIKNTRCTNC